jgi:hypothetical protein
MRGYPDGLTGEAIPIGAHPRRGRLLRCLDVRPSVSAKTDRHRGDRHPGGAAWDDYNAQVVDVFIDLLPELRRRDADVPLQFQVRTSDARPTPSRAAVADADDNRVMTDALRRAGRTAATSAALLLPDIECCVLVPTLSWESLVPAFATPTVEEVLGSVDLRIGEGLSGWVAANRHTIVNSHADLDLGMRPSGWALTNCTSTPIFALGDLAAVFTVYAAPTLRRGGTEDRTTRADDRSVSRRAEG